MSKEFNSHKKYQPLVLDIQAFYKQRAKYRNRVAVRRLSRQIDHEVRLRKAAKKLASVSA